MVNAHLGIFPLICSRMKTIAVAQPSGQSWGWLLPGTSGCATGRAALWEKAAETSSWEVTGAANNLGPRTQTASLAPALIA